MRSHESLTYFGKNMSLKIQETGPKQDDLLTGKIIGAAIEVHRRLGPGLLESTYETCLSYELNLSGLKVQRQIPMSLIYRDVKLDSGYRIDMIVEIKSVSSICQFTKHNYFHTLSIMVVEEGYLLISMLNF